jgi:hypothetical protein
MLHGVVHALVREHANENPPLPSPRADAERDAGRLAQVIGEVLRGEAVVLGLRIGDDDARRARPR